MKGLYRFPLVNLLVILGITLFFLFQLPNLELDNEVMNFVPEGDKELVAVENFKDQYGSVMIMGLVLYNPYGSILEERGLDLNRQLTELLEDLPDVEEIQSLSNTDYISGSGGTLQVMSLSEDTQGNWLSGPEILARLRSWDMYDKMLLSEDGHSTQIGITLKGDIEVEEQEELFRQIHQITSDLLPEGYEYHLAGLPSTTIQISENIRKDLSLLIPFVSILVLLILYLSFRRLGGVILPILNVAVSTLWTVGAMALTHNPLTILGSIIPILMIAVGSAYGIHLVSHYFDEQNLADNPDKEDLRKMVFHTVKVVGIPITMAGLTTIAGFGSLAVSSVIPMRNFGIFTAVGVAAALVVAMVMIPSLLLLNPGKKSSKAEDLKENPLIRELTRINLTRRGLVGFMAVLLLAGALYFIPRLLVDNDITLYFKEGTEVRKAESFISENFSGTSSFNVLITGEEKGSLNHPDVLEFMDNYKNWILEEYPEVSKILSYSDFIKRINQVLHEDSPGRMSLQAAVPTISGSLEESGFGGGDFDSSGFATDNGFDGGSFFADDDSFSDSGFGDDSFVGDSFGDSGSDTTPAPVEQTAAVVSDNALMDTLWTAYQEDPENFMDSLARLTNHKGRDYFEIPSDPEKYNLGSREDLSDLISQYLLLYSGNLDSWSNESLEPSEARMSLQLRVNGTRFTEKIIPEIRQYADLYLPDGYSIEYSGTALVQNSLTRRIVKSMVLSILVSVFLVFLILSITYRSPAAGLIGIVPLSLTVLVNFGVMGLTGIRLDISTAMVGSIAIGIGIDYTIHFLSSYTHHFRSGKSREEVTAMAMHSSGKAIIFNALSVAAGFAVLIFSQFNPLMYFGLLIVITMAVSSLASLTLLPLMLNGLKPRFLEKNK